MKSAPMLGSYVDECTPASEVDARVKIILLLAFTFAVFLAQGPVAFVSWFIMLAACMKAAHIGASSIVRALRPTAVVLLLVLCANLVSCDGSAEVVIAGSFGLSITGGIRGFSALLRIVLLVGCALVVSASTTSTELADACVRLLSPLGRLGAPVAELGTVLSLALRFVPIVGEEFQRIRLAQRARGVDLEGGGALRRVRSWLSIFAPLIIGLFRRSDRLAESMEARCYAGSTQAPPKPLAKRDWVVLACGIALMAAVVLVTRAL